MTTVRSELIEIESDGQRLPAILDHPAGAPQGWALFTHCFDDPARTVAPERIATQLAERGLGVLRLLFTGSLDDLRAAAGVLRGYGDEPKLLIGHSVAGAAVLALADEVAQARAVVTIAAPSDPGRFALGQGLAQDHDAQRLLETVHGMRKALLMFHAPLDQVVPIEDAAAIFRAAFHPKSFVSLDHADHVLGDPADADYVADVIAAWVSRYVGAGAHPPLARTPPTDNAVVVTESGLGHLAQTVRVGRHLLHADEPLAVGGNDIGPGPYDYLLAGLGACTSMTIRMYADLKRIPLQRVAVRLSHRKIHAIDCAECETREGRIDQIEREIELTGDLDAATRQRLLEIAEKCPVHRTLHNEVSITTALKG